MGKVKRRAALEGIEAAIFDLDGTVLDSMGAWADMNEEFLRGRGLAMPEGFMEAVSSMGFLEAARYTKQRFGLPDDAEALRDYFFDVSENYYRRNVRMKPNAARFLHHLKARGVKLGVATASIRRIFMPALQRGGVASLFDAVVTAEDVARGKAYPDIYLEAARRLNARPENCVVFEDILSGTLSAKRAGMRVVGVFDESASHDRARIEAAADLFIEDYAELLDGGQADAD